MKDDASIRDLEKDFGGSKAVNKLSQRVKLKNGLVQAEVQIKEVQYKRMMSAFVTSKRTLTDSKLSTICRFA